MNHHIEFTWAAFIAPISLLILLGSLISFHKYTGLGRDTSFLALLGSVIAGAFSSYHRARAMEPFIGSHYDHENNNAGIFLGIAAAGLFFPLLAAFVFRLWGRWIGGKATPAECEPGVPGIRAWFCGSNVGVAILLVDAAWFGHDFSPLLGAVIVIALLAAAPLLRMESSPALAAVGATPSAPIGEDLSAEREKIVSMLVAGKLTPEEGAELLQALGESASSRPAAKAVPLTGSQRLMLIGAALVTLGFFLPWFVINPGKELSRLTGEMQVTVSNSLGNQFPPQPPGYPPAGSPILQPPGYPPMATPITGDISTSGGDLPHGLGWAALALALAAALIPYVATTLDAATARTIRRLSLGLGAIIVLYLVTQNYRYIGLGLIIALAGYTLEIAGALRERHTPAA